MAAGNAVRKIGSTSLYGAPNRLWDKEIGWQGMLEEFRHFPFIGKGSHLTLAVENETGLRILIAGQANLAITA